LPDGTDASNDVPGATFGDGGLGHGSALATDAGCQSFEIEFAMDGHNPDDEFAVDVGQ